MNFILQALFGPSDPVPTDEDRARHRELLHTFIDHSHPLLYLIQNTIEDVSKYGESIDVPVFAHKMHEYAIFFSKDADALDEYSKFDFNNRHINKVVRALSELVELCAQFCEKREWSHWNELCSSVPYQEEILMELLESVKRGVMVVREMWFIDCSYENVADSINAEISECVRILRGHVKNNVP